ncbi:hypothetical protein AB0E83_23395 [Streptomyces sp. NPDC035033]|uniref:hypothetical protein n=1 Tax=Streptomyces sp. NPDC035033 TaxID=3155368 RepID=UPI0033E95A49
MTHPEGPRAVPAPSDGGSGTGRTRAPLAHIDPPEPVAVGVVGLTLVVAADVAGIIPPGPPSQAAGGLVALVALGALARHCIRRNA